MLDLFENENIVEKNRETAALMGTLLKRFEGMKGVKEVRRRGMIAAVELDPFPPGERRNLEIYRYALQEGVLLRPLGNVLYFMPPYTVTPEEVRRMFEVAEASIARL